jgi:hypothetical protein
MKKLLILIIPFLVLSCESDTGNQREQRAVELNNRITAMIHGLSSSDGYTAEWQAMLQKICDGKDTVFQTSNGDFQILVTVRHGIMGDTTPIAKTAPVSPQDSSKNTWK